MAKLANIADHYPDFVNYDGKFIKELIIADKVADAVAEYYIEQGFSITLADVRAADHRHEMLSVGAASVAMEGIEYDWPFLWSQTAAADALGAELGIWFEPINGCSLAIYPC